ncbi:MD-2-related lipid-recognition protein-like [Calliphora vicina]|uniref:MD-2-related lipid-recognition protein-like n=1 Tax=Calliphora vicina TaxID=7373 RepID=UPI00325B2510
MLAVKIVILFAMMACVLTETINFKPCEINDCDISEVRVEPCTRDNENAVCKLRRRKPSRMEFSFTPNFDADTLEASLVTVKDGGNELPLITMDRDACKYTKCPLKSGESQNYAVDIPIEKKFPLDTYKIKWTFKASSGKQCCFLHEIKLVR